MHADNIINEIMKTAKSKILLEIENANVELNLSHLHDVIQQVKQAAVADVSR